MVRDNKRILRNKICMQFLHTIISTIRCYFQYFFTFILCVSIKETGNNRNVCRSIRCAYKYEVKLYHQQCMIWNEKHFALYAVGHK